MGNYVIVWNENKTEGVIFAEREHKGQWERGSKADALHAAGGKTCNPCSALADYFRESYEEDNKKIQDVFIDTDAAVSKTTYSRRK